MAVAIIVGALVWASAADVLRAADGSAGMSLMDSTVSPPTAVLTMLAAGLPALALCAAAAASRRVTSGLFAFSICLCVLAARGGSIDGWMRRTELPGGYTNLIFEVLIWQGVIVLAVFALGGLAGALRRIFPSLVDADPQHGLDMKITFGRPRFASIAASVLCAAIGGAMSWVVLRATDSNQVVGALALGFGIGALVAQMAFPDANPVSMLFSPGIVAVVAYTLVLMRFDSNEQVLAAWYHHMANSAPSLPSPALALPIFYASAGVAGCCIGISLGRSVSEEEEGQSAHSWSSLYRLVRGSDTKADI